MDLSPDPMPSATDPGGELSALLAAAATGSDSAWRDLVGRYSRRVFAMARSRCRDDEVAEEITQSVFVTVATQLHAGGYREQGRFESWLFRVAMNRVRDEVRRRRRSPVVSSADPDVRAAEPGPPTALPLDLLRRSLDGLSDRDREVVELRHHAGLGFREMAELLGEPIGTLLARHHRALRKLRSLLEAEGVSPGSLEA